MTVSFLGVMAMVLAVAILFAYICGKRGAEKDNYNRVLTELRDDLLDKAEVENEVNNMPDGDAAAKLVREWKRH